MLDKSQRLGKLIEVYGGYEVKAMQVYSDIFDLGYGKIQKSGEYHTLKPNPIIIGNWSGKIKRQIMLEDTFKEQLKNFQTADWAFMNGLTYWGRENKAQNQGQLCCFMIDYDGVTSKLFENFLYGAHAKVFDGHGFYPIPNYIILSGNNIHLYYLLEEPISLHPKAKTELKKLKYGLTRLCWNHNTSEIKIPQYQGINQGFRIIGGNTKNNSVVKAYQLNTHPFSIAELNEYVSSDDRADVEVVINLGSKYSLSEAKQKFPEWYQRVIVEKRPKKTWKCKEDLYKWWLEKLQKRDNVLYGHRYFCIMALAIYAAKCGILDKDRVKNDAMKLLEPFNNIKADEPFTERDIDSALECLDLRYCTFPKHDIEKITAITLPTNRRNGRPQKEHLKIARYVCNIYNPNNSWRNKNGRPKGSGTKKDLIISYKKEHPKATQRDIAKALNISPTTVNKWLKKEE